MKRNRRPSAGRGARDEGLALMNVVTTVDTTDEELIMMARNVLESSARFPRRMVVMVVHGYNDDPRELYEIPEMRPHLRRLVDFGFISILVKSAMRAEWGGLDTIGFAMFGAFEAWLFAEGGFVAGRIEYTDAMMRRFDREVFPAAGEALRRNLRRFSHVAANPDLIWDASPFA